MLIIRIRNKGDTSKKQDQLEQLDQLGNQFGNEANGCEELMINLKPSTLKSSSKMNAAKQSTLVKKKFNKNELISDKLYENEKYTAENHFHHHHFDEQFIDTSESEM